MQEVIYLRVDLKEKISYAVIALDLTGVSDRCVTWSTLSGVTHKANIHESDVRAALCEYAHSTRS